MDESYRLIPLAGKRGKGLYAKVSLEDYATLCNTRWFFAHGYAAMSSKSARKLGISSMMHRSIVSAPKHLDVDHINCDTLDNRRENLRVVTRSVNSQRARRTTPNFYVGVKKLRGRWQARISVDRESLNLGIYDDPAEAARVYDGAALHFFGTLARFNFGPEESIPYVAQRATLSVTNSSGFRGVSRKRRKWRARVNVGKNQFNLGVFDTAEEAARAYDAKAKELFGPKALLNFP